jgi:hypothetical protein
MVKRFLVEVAEGGTEFERLKKEEALLRETIGNFSAAERISRDEAHARRP